MLLLDFFPIVIGYKLTIAKTVATVKVLCVEWQNFPPSLGALTLDMKPFGCWVKNRLLIAKDGNKAVRGSFQEFEQEIG